VHPAGRIVPHPHAVVLGPGPRAGVADVLVRVLVLRLGVVARRARVDEEPEAVALDRAAQREVAVPVLQDRRRVGKTERPQLVVDVRRLAELAGPAPEVVAAEVVAAGLGNDVERRRSTVGFAETAGD